MTGAGDSSSLDDDTEDEDTSVDQDGVFTRDDFGKEARVDRAQPSSKLKNRHQPAHLRRVFSVATHVPIEGLHNKDSTKDTLVVSVEKTWSNQSIMSHIAKARSKDLPANTREASNTEDFAVPHDGHGTSGTLKLLTAQQGGLVKHRRGTSRRHDE